jgi:hypothetical protein
VALPEIGYFLPADPVLASNPLETISWNQQNI